MKDRGTSTTSQKRRADILLVEQGYAASRNEAQAAIAAGTVTANGQKVEKPAQLIDPAWRIEYARSHPYVSRGALKLIAALERFALSPRDCVCLDIGASTGGFTEVLLARGAKRVYAVDVGHGQLHEKLLRDARVVDLEGLNARDVSHEIISEAPDFITADVSFISLALALPQALVLARTGAHLVALVKPQFEVGREHVGKGGIVRNPDDRQRALDRVMSWLSSVQGWIVLGTMESPVPGSDGNREFLIAAKKP